MSSSGLDRRRGGCELVRRHCMLTNLEGRWRPEYTL